MIDRYVVIGNPIGHSLSPSIHFDFARQTGIHIQYRRWLCPSDGFDNTIRALTAAGVKGANVTVPFKEQAAAIATIRSEGVFFSGAANTLKFESDDRIKAYNTDGEGLCRDLSRLLEPVGLELSQTHVLMLGAGGAARGCLSAFKAHGVQHLTILNRTAGKAADLARLSQSIGLAAIGGALTDHATRNDLPLVIVNASASSLKDESLPVHQSWWDQSVLCLDMMYGAKPTAFMEQALLNKKGIVVADGLGMLVNQAALAFEIWTSLIPDASSTLMRMRQTLAFR